MADQEQGNIRQEYNNATVGLNMDQIPSQLQKGKYSYCLNGAIENFDANGYTIQNEAGNEACISFPDGFVLIGSHFIVEQTKHIFFITNPSTGDCQIGYMNNNDCVYHILIDASCLNFDIHHPIHKVVHKINNCSTEIYWTDGYNPRRYLNIDPNEIPKILKYGSPLCTPGYSSEIDCNQLKIQPNFNIPLLTIVDVANTGNLIAGVYQFTIQYSDAVGNPYTSYYSVTNPVPIADTHITTVNFNYPVGKSIIIDVNNLETSGLYTYFNIAVIKTINAVTNVELVGTYSIENSSTQITYTGQNTTNIRLSIKDIFEKYPYYDIAGDLTTAQDVLIWDDLTAIDRINYQQIANNISLQWETWRIPATEDYSNEFNATNLRGYLRDEVYAFEIVFLLANGKETDGFHIPGRAKDFNELTQADIPENDEDFVGEPTYYNGGIGYSPYWKIYNTASLLGYSPNYSPSIDYKGAYQYGEFAYWESTEEYPCNTNVWGALAGQKIRHHKFPDVAISPIIEGRVFTGASSMSMGDDAIFPIGVKVDVQQIYALVNSSNLTAEQKSEIVGFKIVRGDRSTNKSIVAKGILRNVNTYTRDSKDYYFANYPYNDLRVDPFLNKTNNAYSDTCSAFSIDITDIFYDPNVDYDRALVQYTDCNTNKSAVKEYLIVGVQSQLCSIGKPTISFGKGTVSYIDYDEWELSANGLPGWMAEYEDITKGLWQGFVGGNGLTVQVVIDTTPACISFCSHYLPPVFKGRHVSSTSCVSPEPLPVITDSQRVIFNSPETSFGQPFLGDILKVESVIFGAGKAHFTEVKENAKYKLISKEAQKKALDSSAALGSITSTFDTSAMFAAYQAYLEIYLNGITRKNYAYSFNSIADYNYTNAVPSDMGVKQRNVDIARYIIPAVVSVDDNKDVNNWERETSVYIKTDSNKTSLPFAHESPNMMSGITPIVTEYSRFTISEKSNCSEPGKEEDIQVVSYYASLKKDFINQWGQIYSYETIDTGFQRLFNYPEAENTIFGGDTYICRFAFKTKLPFFIDNRVGAPDDSDIFYDEIGNVGYPKYWHSARSVLADYSVPSHSTGISPGTLVNFISYKAHNFDCPNDTSIIISSGTTTSTTTIYQSVGIVTPGESEKTFYDGFFYLFSYGVPNFYCESSYNVDLRQAFNNREGDFWPHVCNSIPDDWVQEYFVSIANDNTYYYNTTFSKQNKENYFSHLPADWEDKLCFTYYPFRAIYSDAQNIDSDNRINSWRIYRAVSYYDFPQNYGDLVSLDGVQNRAILARFVNKTLMYGNLLTVDTSNPQAAYLGNPMLFKGAPPIDYADTDLGYAGSQNKLLLKIPQGQITVDAKRGQVFLLSGTEAVDISAFGSGMNRFLTDHLSFEIQRYFPTVDVDNHFNGLGLHGVYDAKYDRVIITKLDYIPIDSNVGYDDSTKEFYITNEEGRKTIVYLRDSNYFCNKSWTLSFNMNTKSWISFHSYIPNWYIAENNFFYSGINSCCEDFDFIAGQIPSQFDVTTTTTSTTLYPPTTTTTTTCDGCTTTTTTSQIPTTTTTTTFSGSTTTSTTTEYIPPCELSGEAEEVTTSTSTTTSTTTICVRLTDMNTYYFITGFTIDGLTVDSTTDALTACDVMNWLANTPIPGLIINYINIEAYDLHLGSSVYLKDGTGNCECNVPDGWYYTEESMAYGYIFHVGGCIIDDIVSCVETTTTSTTLYPPTTSTTTTGEPTTTTTSTTVEPTTTTTTTCEDCTTTTTTTCEGCTTTTTSSTTSTTSTTTTTTTYYPYNCNLVGFAEEVTTTTTTSTSSSTTTSTTTIAPTTTTTTTVAPVTTTTTTTIAPPTTTSTTTIGPSTTTTTTTICLLNAHLLGVLCQDYTTTTTTTCYMPEGLGSIPIFTSLTLDNPVEMVYIPTPTVYEYLCELVCNIYEEGRNITDATVVYQQMGGEDCDIDSVPTNCYVYDSITGCYVEDGYYLTGAGDFIIQVEDGMLIIPDVCFCFTTTTTTTLEVTTTTTTTCEECCYGLLYNWYTVDTGDLAPSGWHVPSDTEWTTLSTYLGGDSVAGGKMKSICCWTEPNEATNESMFTAFPDGCRTYEGYFDQINLFGNWWSSTEYSSENVWYRNIFCNNTILNRPYAYKNYGFNIRCLLDGVDPTDPGSVTDIDGNIYPTVKIGTQVWMAENLKVTRLNDGTPIPEITDDTEWAGMTTMALCAYNNDWDNVCIPQPTTTTTSTTCYFCLGMQYNWYAVNNSNGLAPEGWHIPSKTEFETLLNSIDTYDPDLGYWPLAGGKLKDFCGWSPNIGATNETGWSGYGGGQRQIVGVGPFFTVTWGYEELGEWWTSTEVYSSNAWNLVLSYSGPITHLYNDSRKGWGVSVRCIRDTSEGWIEGETVEDYDGNIYHTVQIGTQIWMVEDLTTSHYKNGVSINYYPADVDWCYDTDGAFCVYNNNWNYACIDEITTTTTTTTSP